MQIILMVNKLEYSDFELNVATRITTYEFRDILNRGKWNAAGE